MAGYYGVIFPEFWTGRTGRELRQQGGKDAQLLALYLATNRHANMIGLYRLLSGDIAHETGLGRKAIERGFMAVAATGFADFDADSSYVWVRQMARFRLGLRQGTGLASDDNRVLAVNRIYHALDPNPFLGAFFDVNAKILRLKKRRDDDGLVVAPQSHHNPSSFEGASKGLISQVQRSGTGIRDQEQEKARLTPLVHSTRSPRENQRVIRALVTDIVKRAPSGSTFTDLKELAKDACANRHLAYDSETVGSALEQVLARSRAS